MDVRQREVKNEEREDEIKDLPFSMYFWVPQKQPAAKATLLEILSDANGARPARTSLVDERACSAWLFFAAESGSAIPAVDC